MKSMQYIDWDNLKNIPFCLCQVVEDEENQDIDIYYLGKRVLHDYDHVGHYLRSAIVLFGQIRKRTADWVNLENLWTLRNCIRENYNHWYRCGRTYLWRGLRWREPKHTYTTDKETA